MLASSGNEGVAILQRYGHKLLTLQYESSEDEEHLEVPKMLQEFDLPARWTSLIQDHFAEAVHNLAQMWPDEQSLEVSYRVIEGFDHEFAHDIVEHPELHFHASNQALRNSSSTPATATCTPSYASSIYQATKSVPFLNSGPMT